MAIMKKCSNIMCNELIPRGQQPPYRDTHNTRTHTDRHYDRHRRNKKHQEFYSSTAWQRFRVTVLAEHHYMCSECQGIANTVHHIVEVADDWSKRLERSNCVPICTSCHNKLHKKS